MNERYKEYEPETLHHLHKVQLEILRDFIRICDEHNLDYFMGWGSMIGVIRHGGFIPWDDDVDIAMPRKDYKKLIQVIEEKWEDKYSVLNTEKNPAYACSVTHLQKKGTKFVSYNARNLRVDMGISIDVFPLDNVSDDKDECKKQLRQCWFLGRLLYLSENAKPIIPLSGMILYLSRIVCFCVHYMLKLFRITPIKIYQWLQKAATRYNQKDTARFAAMFDNAPSQGMIAKSGVYPLIDKPFAGISVKVPNNYDQYLTKLYGDYMSLPPVEERVNHCPYILDFGEE